MALHLTRKLGQKVVIGGDIVIAVTDNCPKTGDIVLSIDAPRMISIYREEIWEKIKNKYQKDTIALLPRPV